MRISQVSSICPSRKSSVMRSRERYTTLRLLPGEMAIPEKKIRIHIINVFRDNGENFLKLLKIAPAMALSDEG